MNYFNYTSKKIIFTFPILAIVMLVNFAFAKINVSQNLFFEEVPFYFNENQQQNDVNKFNFVNVEKEELVYAEETEVETEFELEFELGAIPTIHANFLEVISEKENLFTSFHQFKTNQKIPLYDLYCNWKYHLS